MDIKDIIKAIDGASDSDKKRIAKKLQVSGGGGGTGDLEAQNTVLEAYIKKLDSIQASEEARVLKMKAQQEIAENQLALAKEKIASGEGDIDTQLEALRVAQDNLDVAERQILALERQASQVERTIDASKQLGGSIGSALTPFNKSAVFNIDNLKMFKDAMQGGAAGMVEMVKSGFSGFIDSVIGGFMGALFAIDEFESAIGRATNQVDRDFARAMRDGADQMANFYVGLEEYSAATITAFGTVTEFSEAQANIQRELVNTATTLELYGASVDDVSNAFQTLDKVAGLSLDQVGGATMEIANLAMAINVPIQDMMSDFSQMLPNLAKLGPTAVDSFKDLAIQSKRTGLEIQKILNLTDQFDTFEGAAEMSGQLNAALGGNFVNAMDMMMETDPVKRFEMMTDAIDQAGLSFDDMSYYQRQFFANAMGLESVQDLAMMMSGDMSALGDEVNMTQQNYQDMAKAAAEQATLQEKFDAALRKIMQTLVKDGLLDDLHQMFDDFKEGRGPIADLESLMHNVVDVFRLLEPVLRFMIENPKSAAAIFIALQVIGPIQMLKGISKGFGKIKDMVKGGGDIAEGVKKIGEEMTDAAGAGDDLTTKMQEMADEGESALDTVSDAASDVSEKMGDAGEVADTASGPIQDMGEAAENAGDNAGKSSVGLMKMALAVLAIGAGIGLAALGMAQFVKAFEGFEYPEILAISVALIAFGVAIAILVLALVKLAPLILGATASVAPLAGIMMALGGAVFLAGIGMGELVKSFKDMDVSKIEAIGVAVSEMAAAFAALAFGVAAMGNPLALVGAAALAGLIYLLSETMEDIMNVMAGMDAGIIKPLGAVFTAIGEGTDGSISTEFKEIARVLKEDMDFGELSELTAMLTELKSASNSLGTMSRTSANGSQQNQTVEIELSLDATATESLLNGQAVNAQGILTGRAFGTVG